MCNELVEMLMVITLVSREWLRLGVGHVRAVSFTLLCSSNEDEREEGIISVS